MAGITNEGDFYAMMMEAERPRDTGTYLNYFDLNGDYVNFRFDRDVLTLADEVLQENFERLRFDFNGEYIEMTWVLKTPFPLDRDVYIFGGLSEYQLKPNLKMIWNPQINAYVGRTLLKQGFYNYHYVTEKKPEKGFTDRINYEQLEGSFDETENDYLALAYWRPIGGRYDRLVGALLLNSTLD